MCAGFGLFLKNNFGRKGVGVDVIAEKSPPSNFFNEKSGEVYSHYLQTEMQTLHPDLHNNEGVFFRLSSILNKVDCYNENVSDSKALFIESLDVNITKFEKEFVPIGEGRKGNFVKYIADLRMYGGVQHLHLHTGLQYFKYAVIVVGHKSLRDDASRTFWMIWQLTG